jgi:hypothetical protein
MWMYIVAAYWIAAELYFFTRYIAACRTAQTTQTRAYLYACLCVGVLAVEIMRVELVLWQVFPAPPREWVIWLAEHTPFALYWYEIVTKWLAKLTQSHD